MAASKSPEDRLIAASRSSLIWELGVIAAMRHFSIRNEDVHRAREMFLLERGAKAVVAAQHEQKRTRMLGKVVGAEKRYPGVSDCLALNDIQTVVEALGLSRQRVHVLRRNLLALAESRKETVAATMVAVKMLARG